MPAGPPEEPTRLRGEPVAEEIRASVRARVATLTAAGAPPALGTVLMSDDPADQRFMALKHDACEAVGIETVPRRLDPDAPAERLHRAIEALSADDDVDAVFVQAPLPAHVSMPAVRRRVAPGKDVDCFHPVNLGRLVRGDPRFVPATPAAIERLLDAYDVRVEGADVVVVGRSSVIGTPLANRLWGDGPGGNATVTVCHSRTPDLGSVTRRADVLVTACGVPELVDGSMLSRGVAVVDVSVNRRPDAGGGEAGVVGDVAFESAAEVASAITPVPGGVGPVTLAALLSNVVRAAEGRRGDGDGGAT